MAHGDIERYSRLRRPKFVTKEPQGVVRGIYHNTLFALWWSRQDLSKMLPDPIRIRQAVMARMIMNKFVPPSVSQTPHRDLPYLIWYPSIAVESTYRELYHIQPAMAPQILRSCLAGGRQYLGLFEDVWKTIEPDSAVVKDTK